MSEPVAADPARVGSLKTLADALRAYFSLPNWRNRSGPWRDVREALDALHAAYRVARFPAWDMSDGRPPPGPLDAADLDDLEGLLAFAPGELRVARGARPLVYRVGDDERPVLAMPAAFDWTPPPEAYAYVALAAAAINALPALIAEVRAARVAPGGPTPRPKRDK